MYKEGAPDPDFNSEQSSDFDSAVDIGSGDEQISQSVVNNVNGSGLI